jgi:hypothetical protein
MNIIGYVLFFLGGLGFGYAAPAGYKLLPFFFPLALALGALILSGLKAEVFLKLLIALIITAAGIALGWMLDERSREGEAAEAH